MNPLMPFSFLSHGDISPHHFSPSHLTTIDAFLLINLMYIIYITWLLTILFGSWTNSHIYIALHIRGSKSGCYILLPIMFSLSSMHITIQVYTYIQFLHQSFTRPHCILQLHQTFTCPMPLFLSIVSFLLPIYSLFVGGIASFFPFKYTIFGVLLSKYSIHVLIFKLFL